MDKLNHQIDWELIKRSVNQELSDEEQVFLNIWLSQKEEHQAFYHKAVTFYNEGQRIPLVDNKQVNQAWTTFINGRKKRRQINWHMMSVAASVILLIGLAIVFYLIGSTDTERKTLVASSEEITTANVELILSDGSVHELDESGKQLFVDGAKIVNQDKSLVYDSDLRNDSVKYNTIIVPRFGAYQLILSDGTKVRLNALSSLTFPVSFKGERREVQLTGEAYFEVAHDKSRPFIVNDGRMNVKVLGTRFNHRAYAAEKESQVTLCQGSVSVTHVKKLGEEAILKPGEYGVISNDNNGIEVGTADVRSAIAWLNNEFIFEGQPLKVILEELVLWYGNQIDIADPEVEDMSFFLYISRDMNFNKVLDKLEQTGKVSFKKEYNRIIAYKTK